MDIEQKGRRIEFEILGKRLNEIHGLLQMGAKTSVGATGYLALVPLFVYRRTKMQNM